jgi:hypothetical protein
MTGFAGLQNRRAAATGGTGRAHVTGGPDIILARHISREPLQECLAGSAATP